jgi:TonB family protein
MRRSLIAVLLLLPAIAFAATYETHSTLHSLTVEVLSDGYVARVTDLTTGNRVMSVHVPAEGGKSEAVEGNRRVVVEVRRTKHGLWGSFDVEQDGKKIDAMQTRWVTEPNVLRVGGDVKAPVVVQRVEPQYPEEARRERVQGIVIVEAFIDKEGNVGDIEVLKPLPMGLDQAAVDAVRQWKFQPATMNGEPVNVVFNLTINFRLK